MKSSLGKRILAPTLALVAAGLAITLVVTYFTARQAAHEELANRMQRETQLAARLIDSWLQARTTDLTIWAQQTVLTEALTEQGYYGKSAQDGATLFLSVLRQGHPFYESVFLANVRGEVTVFSTMVDHPLAQINLADRPYFKEALAGNKAISPILVSRLTGQPIFVIAAPVRANEKIVGVIGGVVDAAAFQALFLNDFKLKKNGEAVLADADGLVIASSRDNEDELALQPDLLQRITSGRPGMFSHRQNQDNILTVFQPLQHSNWTFIVHQSLDATLQPLLKAEKISATTGLVLFALLASIIAALFRRLVTERLQTMLQSIDQIKAGDLNGRIPLPAAVEDEVSGLIESFNAMTAQLDAAMKKLNDEIEIRKSTEQMLAYHQENLEHIIADRSLALESEIIERKRVEERLARVEKLEMIGALAGGVAHDLNNILSGIITYPDLLLLKLPADSPLVKPLQSIKLSGEKAAAIIQDLLTLARRGARVKKETVCLNRVIAEYLHSPEHQQLRSRRPDIEVVAACGADLHPVVGSLAALTKAVSNLTCNAAEAMGQGGTIRIATENRRLDTTLKRYEQINPGQYAVLTVEDQGGGIEPEDLARIFEPFHTSKKMGQGGTGLGMAVVWGTVKDHDGFIDCASQKGQGARFELYFPATADPVQDPPPHTPRTPDVQGRGEKILIIDDSREQRELAAATLKELGYATATAATGEEGAALLAREPCALVLLDMMLGPGIDGLNTYRRIREHVPQQKVVIVSGYAESERVATALRLGVREYLKKPYAIAELGQTVRRVLDAQG